MGRRQAVYYGEILRYLRIPISYPIISSLFCRTIETSQLAFGRTNVLVDPFWFEIYKLSEDLSIVEQAIILESLRAKLELRPPQGSNKVIIAHSFPSGVGLGEIPNMGTVVIKPLGQGKGYEIVARLSLEELASLLR
ncbi:hypothetical protein SDC9_187180 [bioreactor metagenome]|uniref:Uncharacterized protein n=1 Tax=bioreactor metagenome TaxID=1076179 RepID=A0A645HMI1_9ZZZZ